MTAPAATARRQRAVKPAWWLLSEDLALDGDLDDEDGNKSKRPPSRSNRQNDSTQSASDHVEREEQKAKQVEKDLKEAVNHAV